MGFVARRAFGRSSAVRTISESGHVLPILIATIFFQTAAHVASLRPRFRGEWIRPAAFYLVAAALIAAAGFAFGPRQEANIFACLASSALFQVVPFRVAADLSRRLRPE